MELTILGSGTAVIREKRLPASFLLRTDTGKNLLLDAGWGAPMRILQARQDPQTIDHILISHPHADHMASLIPILQSMLVAGYDVSGGGWQERERKKPLYLHGYSGFTAHYEELRKIMMPERAEKYPINIFEYKDDTRFFNDITIIGIEVTHVPQFWSASAFRIEADGASIVYSGDCGYDERLVKLAKDADFGLFDASVPPWMYKNGPRPNHMSPFECGLVAYKADVKTLALFHLYDNDTKENIENDVRKNFSGELIITEDIQRFHIPKATFHKV